MAYITECKKCGGQLELRTCIAQVHGVPIYEDGFCFSDASSINTSDEVVGCIRCDWTGDLEHEED